MVKQRKNFDYNKGTESDTDIEVDENKAKSNDKRANYESSLSEELDDEINTQTEKLPTII